LLVLLLLLFSVKNLTSTNSSAKKSPTTNFIPDSSSWFLLGGRVEGLTE